MRTILSRTFGISIIVLLGGWIAPQALAEADADAIVGIWLDQDAEGQVEIFRKDGKYFGKIVRLIPPRNPDGSPVLDEENPDEKLRSRPVLGLVTLFDLSYEDGRWVGGRIYDPDNGKFYSCSATLSGMNTLDLRGYIGFSMLGRTEVWKRVETQVPAAPSPSR